MKKNYVSPLTEEVNVETTQMLAVSTPLNDEEVNTDTDQRAGNRRGDWGNLWN